MLIGIIGAGIAGLTAGRELARAGHEVIVIEKSHGFGGRLSTRYSGENNKIKIDHGLGYLSAKSDAYRSFIAELSKAGIVKPWVDQFSLYTDGTLYKVHPARETSDTWIAPNGMNSIGKYMSRWMDFRLGERVGGVTLVAPNKSHKRAWVMNLTSTKVLEVDALIVATPAINAVGILQKAQDETPVRSLYAKLSKVKYESCHVLIATYDTSNAAQFSALICQDSPISWISNENSKRDMHKTSLVIHSTPEFTKAHANSSDTEIAKSLMEEAGRIVGTWAGSPETSEVHFWKYQRAMNSIEEPYLETGTTGIPLAVVGDYLNGNSVETAYMSGLTLAKTWVERYPVR